VRARLPGARASDGYLDLGTGPRTRLHLDARPRDGVTELIACGGQTRPLLHEEARISVRLDELTAQEATIVAPYLADHPGAALLRFVSDGFGGWELRTGATPHPFAFYSSLLLEALEAKREECGLWLVGSVGIAAPGGGPVVRHVTRFLIVRP
jgi:hypothetical protein